jgi:hypothetical protein
VTIEPAASGGQSGSLLDRAHGGAAIAPFAEQGHRRIEDSTFEDGRRFRWEGSFLWLGLGYDHLVTTDEVGRVGITFIVEGAGAGVDTIGPLFAGIYGRSLDRAIPRLQALLRSPDRARPQ